MTADKRYPLAPNGVFMTIQGEGILLGVPMIFVRLAGCSVGCLGCDTNYTVAQRIHLLELFDRIESLRSMSRRNAIKWVWLTGGEPTDHDIAPIVRGCHDLGLKVALATAGVKRVMWNSSRQVDKDTFSVDFLSVSPHFTDERWVQRSGDQVNFVPMLNGLRFEDLDDLDLSGFNYKYITPYDSKEVSTLADCKTWVNENPGWRLGIQAHKIWGIA